MKISIKSCLRPVDDFMNEFHKKTAEHPFSRHFRIFNDAVLFEVKPTGDSVRLSMIQTIDLGRGQASPALDWLVNLAVKHGVCIEGRVDRQGKDGLTTKDLKAWYKRHSFSVVKDVLYFSPDLLLAIKAQRVLADHAFSSATLRLSKS